MTEDGRYAYDGLDRVLHEKARLGILTALAGRPEGLVFTDLKALCALTDGNLSRHLARLEEATLVEAWEEEPDEGHARTRYALSAAGRARFLEYLAELERVVADARALGDGRLRPRTS